MITHEIDTARSFVFAEIRGEVSEEDVIAWVEELLRELAGSTRIGGVVDVRHVTTFEISGETIRYLVEMVAKNEFIFAGSRWAFVAEQEVVYGMTRMYQLMRDAAPYELEPFRTIEEARAWLEPPGGESDGR